MTVKLAEVEPWKSTARNLVKKSVALLGFTSTPLLQETGATPYKYRVVAGRRRLDAAAAAGLECVTALVIGADVTEADVRALGAMSNLARSSSPVDEAFDLHRLVELGHTPADLAKLFGISKAVIEKRLKLASLPDALLEAVRRGDMAPGVAADVANLTLEQQEQLIQRLETQDRITGADVKAVRLAQKEAAVKALPESLFGPIPELTPSERFKHAARQALAEGVTTQELARLLEEATKSEVTT
jgi:ParB/RepB/Spo0J family partition protein